MRSVPPSDLGLLQAGGLLRPLTLLGQCRQHGLALLRIKARKQRLSVCSGQASTAGNGHTAKRLGREHKQTLSASSACTSMEEGGGEHIRRQPHSDSHGPGSTNKQSAPAAPPLLGERGGEHSRQQPHKGRSKVGNTSSVPAERRQAVRGSTRRAVHTAYS